MTIVIRPLHTAPFSPVHIGARRTSQRSLVGAALAALLIVAAVIAPAAPAYAAGTIAVDTTVDEFGAGPSCSLREAIQSANTNTNFGGCIRSSTPPFTINLGAGTFVLTIPGNEDLNAAGDLDILASGTIIAGAGAASTTIQQTTADRVIDVNPTVAASFSASISNLRITGGNTSSSFGGGGILAGDSNGAGTVTLNSVTVDGNTASAGAGGGINLASRGNLVISNSTIANNTASSTSSGQGGGIFFLAQGPEQLTITNSTISGNRAARAAAATAVGGGLHASATGGTVTILRTHFVNNRAADTLRAPTGAGGAIGYLNGTLNVSFSRFVDNVATSGSGIFQSAGGGSSTANDNWWGVNTGPGAGVLAGAPAPTATRWLQLRHSANPPAVPTNTSTTLTADLLGLNTGGSTAAGNLSGLPPFPQPAGVIFNNAVLGTLSGAATQFTNGAATATYTAGATPGSGSADATADSQTVTANFNVPLAVLLAGFSAQGQADRVLVQWDTVSEIGNLGFNLWRGVSPDEPDTQLNTGLIPSQAPGSTQGYSYEWTDQANLVAGTTYYYWLESVDAYGVVTRYGPVSATLSVPTAVTLGDLSANPASAGSAAWGLPALLASLGAAAALARRRYR